MRLTAEIGAALAELADLTTDSWRTSCPSPSFERYPLLFGPSPGAPARAAHRRTSAARALWAKREDCNSGIAYGGNKTRKLEYLVADALAKGCDTLVSIGGVQSNHTRQVAAVAARAGLQCVLVQESWVDWPDSVYDKVGNILISRLAGADVRLVRAGFGIGFKESWEQALSEVEESGGKPYAIPAGASDHPLGGLGFADWAYEVAEQDAAARRLLRHRGRVLGDRVDPGRHGRRVRGAGGGRRPYAARARHRRVGGAGPDEGTDRADRAEHRSSSSASSGS